MPRATGRRPCFTRISNFAFYCVLASTTFVVTEKLLIFIVRDGRMATACRFCPTIAQLCYWFNRFFVCFTGATFPKRGQTVTVHYTGNVLLKSCKQLLVSGNAAKIFRTKLLWLLPFSLLLSLKRYESTCTNYSSH